MSSISLSSSSCNLENANIPHEFVGIGIENEVVILFVVKLLLLFVLLRLLTPRIVSELAIRCKKLGDSVGVLSFSDALFFLNESKRNMVYCGEKEGGEENQFQSEKRKESGFIYFFLSLPFVSFLLHTPKKKKRIL